MEVYIGFYSWIAFIVWLVMVETNRHMRITGDPNGRDTPTWVYGIYSLLWPLVIVYLCGELALKFFGIK